MFVGRSQELRTLNKFYNRNDLDIVGVYGRRRVGKTALLKEFMKGKKTIFFSAEEATESVNLQKISEVYANALKIPMGVLDSWENVFDNLSQLSQNERLLFIIDEFPYLQSSQSSFLSKFQHIIDHVLENSNIMIVLCGSSIGFMEDELFAEKSPLFGRLTGQIYVKPFDYLDASKLMAHYSYEDKMTSYFILGGMPYYLNYFNYNLSVKENIIEKILDASEVLYNAPQNMIRQELRSPAIYNSIIQVISEGATKSNQINTKIGVAPNIGQNYLTTLMKLHLVDKLMPVGGTSKRKTYYRISDQLFNFVYRFCYRYRSLIELDLGEKVFSEYIESKLYQYYGKQFETVCREYMIRLNQSLFFPELLIEIGSWWGGNPKTKVEEEIDIVGLGETIGIYCECKYKNDMMDLSVLEELIRKSLLIPKPEMHYYLFSKSGFSKALLNYASKHNKVNLITIEDMFNINNKK